MTTIKKNVTPEQKERWQNFCRKKGVTESDMLGLLLHHVTDGEIGIVFEGLNLPKSEKVTVRLDKKTIQKMSERAMAEGFPSRTSWATNMLVSVLDNDPVLTGAEIEVLRESNRELAAIGRNLNQIAHAINIDFRDSDQMTRDFSEALSAAISQHRKRVSALLDRALNRWTNEEQSGK